MFKVENFGLGGQFDFTLPFECEIHHCFPKSQPSISKYSVLIHYMEPSQLKWSNQEVREFHSSFDLILTNENSLLDLPNTKFALFGGRYVNTLPKNKNFSLSYLYSGGIGHEEVFRGYKDRRITWKEKDKIIIPKNFFTSNNRPPKDINNLSPYPFSSKNELFDSMFSIIIENDYQENYFSEKLIDALSTFTVPVYFGSPNIDSYFDTKGMIIPKDVPQMIEIINSLSPEDYYSRYKYIYKNYNRSKEYWDIFKMLKKYILNSFIEC